MSTEPENVLLDHAYDGIEEYDNQMPAWWVWLFVASIVFAPFYFIYYHMSPSDRSLQAEALALACHLGHPVYDCLYLVLARREVALLLTADQKLLQLAAQVLP